MLRGLVLISLAAVAWGTTGAVTTVLVRSADAHPLLIGSARMWVATLTGIAVAALIAICSAPLMIAALAPVALGERLTVRLLTALALGVLGTALLVAEPPGGAPAPERFLAGTLLALAAGLAYALYVILAKASLVTSRPLPLTALTFVTAAVVLTPVVAWTEAPLRQIEDGWPWLLYLGAVATAGAYALYAIGLRRVPASVAGIVSLVEPLTATLLGVLVFGERLGTAGAWAQRSCSPPSASCSQPAGARDAFPSGSRADSFRVLDRLYLGEGE